MVRARVVLPEPDCPTSATISPRPHVRFTESTALTLPPRPAKVTDRFRASSTTSAGSGALNVPAFSSGFAPGASGAV